MDTIFCSLDQSTKKTGWCIWQNGIYKESGLIDHEKEKNASRRFAKMTIDIFTLLDRYKPVVLYIEDTALQRNVKTLKELSQLQGTIIGYAVAKDIDVQIIAPSEWRKILGIKTGAGIKREALKKECLEWVERNIGITRSEDEIEAIAIGAAVLALWNCDVEWRN